MSPRYVEASTIEQIAGYTLDINRDCFVSELGQIPQAAELSHVQLLSHPGQAPLGQSELLEDSVDDPREGQGPSPFSLGETFTPIPSKLVKKIQSQDFVDMPELLPDNVELMRREEDTARRDPLSCSRRQLRRVGDLLTWVQCFSTYAAVLTEKHPHRVRELLGYLRLIARESQKNGGEGWRHYDTTFRKLAAADRSLPWNKPLPSLYATSFLAKRLASPRFCEHCMEGDHTSQECALDPGTPARVRFSQFRQLPSGIQSQGFIDFNSRPICKRWNNATCKGIPECTFRHACARCGKRGHKVSECTDRSASNYSNDAAVSRSLTGSSR